MGGEIEQKGKRTHGHGRQCDDCRREGGMRRINGNGRQLKDFIVKIKEALAKGKESLRKGQH